MCLVMFAHQSTATVNSCVAVIECSDYDGNNRLEILSDVAYVYALAVEEDVIYYSTYPNKR